MTDYTYRYTCRGCGAVREVRTLRELTATQKRHIREKCGPGCELRRLMHPDDKN